MSLLTANLDGLERAWDANPLLQESLGLLEERIAAATVETYLADKYHLNAQNTVSFLDFMGHLFSRNWVSTPNSWTTKTADANPDPHFKLFHFRRQLGIFFAQAVRP